MRIQSTHEINFTLYIILTKKHFKNMNMKETVENKVDGAT